MIIPITITTGPRRPLAGPSGNWPESAAPREPLELRADAANRYD